MLKPTLIQFRWNLDDQDPLDYLGYADLSVDEYNAVMDLLNRAEKCGRIEKDWYLGPFDDKPQVGKEFIAELKEALNLDIYEEA